MNEMTSLADAIAPAPAAAATSVNPYVPPAPTNGHQPPGQPQFEPDKPIKAEDWSKVSLDDYLSGRAGG